MSLYKNKKKKNRLRLGWVTKRNRGKLLTDQTDISRVHSPVWWQNSKLEVNDSQDRCSSWLASYSLHQVRDRSSQPRISRKKILDRGEKEKIDSMWEVSFNQFVWLPLLKKDKVRFTFEEHFARGLTSIKHFSWWPLSSTNQQEREWHKGFWRLQNGQLLI